MPRTFSKAISRAPLRPVRWLVIGLALLALALAIPAQPVSAQPGQPMSLAELGAEIGKLDEAARARRPEETFNRLRFLTESGRLQDVPPEVVETAIEALRSTRKADFLEYAYDLATSERFAQLDSGIQRIFAFEAIDHAFNVGDRSRVEDLLRYIRRPEVIALMLSNKVYQSIWPELEHIAAENLAGAAEGYVRWAERRFSEAPTDRSRFAELAKVYYDSGRFEEAIALVSDWREAPGAIARIQEEDGWAMTNEAASLDALGRRAEADRVYDQLAGLAHRRHPWVLEFALRRSSRLLNQGRWADALAAMDRSRRLAENNRTTIAKFLVAADRACALHRLGRQDEADVELAYLQQNIAAAESLVPRALVCAGRDAEGEALLGRILARDDGWRYFSGDVRLLHYRVPTETRTIAEFIYSHPALRDRMLEHVRAIPEEFLPLGIRRQKESGAGAPAVDGPGSAETS